MGKSFKQMLWTQDYGYTYQKGDTPIQGKVAAQKYIRRKSKI